jgi:streptogramin lyase
MNRFTLFVIVLFLTRFTASSQPFAIGNWQEHLPYLAGKGVAVSDTRVYCATDDGLFAYQKSDQSLVRFSRLSGLNDFGIRTIAYSKQYKVLIIAYNNTNIDLLYDDDHMLNMSDIKRKNIPGGKVINKVSIDGRYVYLSCGFGIVVIDLERKEIKDTYYISNASAAPEVLDVAADASWLYAAAEDGVYRAAINDPLLSNYSAWTKIISDTGNVGSFNQAEIFNTILFVNYSKTTGDTMLAWNGAWGLGLPVELQQPQVKRNVFTDNGRLYVTEATALSVYDNALVRIKLIDGTFIPNPDFSDGIEDAAGEVWLAERTRGLLSVNVSGYEKFLPVGPNSSRITAMQVVDGMLWVMHGPRTRGWRNGFQYDGFSKFNSGAWVSFDGKAAQTPFIFQYNLYDNLSLAVDPSDKNHLFIGSAGSGLFEFKNDQVIAHYDTSNSPLQGQVGNLPQCRVHGIALDRDRNLWVSNAGVANVLKVLKNDGTWKSFSFLGAINSYSLTGDVLVDNNGFIWLTVFENTGGKEGILIFNPNFTIDNTSDDQFEIAEFGSNRVRCMAMDKEGTIWAGTEGGVYVFYPPSATPQQILIRQDNSYQYLLAAETVTAIAVDGANRKWIGTENGGLYLFTADGQKQVLHFTTENSPLFSNNITSLAIDGKSGQVYVGTDKGLMSYQGDALDAGELIVGCEDVLVYPNPVKKEYDGPVAIKGVVPNGVFKITDINGGLVYQSSALGSQAIWDGRNLQGGKVSTGVYLVFSSDASGENTCVTKLMYFR